MDRNGAPVLSSSWRLLHEPGHRCAGDIQGSILATTDDADVSIHSKATALDCPRPHLASASLPLFVPGGVPDAGARPFCSFPGQQTVELVCQTRRHSKAQEIAEHLLSVARITAMQNPHGGSDRQRMRGSFPDYHCHVFIEKVCWGHKNRSRLPQRPRRRVDWVKMLKKREIYKRQIRRQRTDNTEIRWDGN